MNPRDTDRGWNTPVRTNSPANDVIRALRAQLSLVEREKQPQELARVLYGGTLGVFHAARVLPEGGDFLRIEVKKQNGNSEWIVAPVVSVFIYLFGYCSNLRRTSGTSHLGFCGS